MPRYEVSTESGSDRVATLVLTPGRDSETRSLPLSVLTSSPGCFFAFNLLVLLV